MSSAKKAIFLTIALDLVGLTIIFPIFPEIMRRFDVSAMTVGWLGSIYALCSFAAGPLLGRLSDRIGRKKILFTSVVGSAIGWFLTGFAPNIWFVFLGRIIDGVTAGNITIAQAILGDISRDATERAKYYGIFGMMFGLSMIVGPLLGGVLIRFGFAVPFIVSGLLSAINAVMILTILPETHTERTAPSKRESFSVFRAFGRGLLAKYLWLALIVGLGTGVYRNSFGIYMDAFYHLDATHIGYLLAIVGIFMAFCQGVLLGKFWLKKFTPERILTINLIASVIFFGLTALYDQTSNPSVFIWIIGEVCMVFFTIAMWPVIQAQGMSHTDPAIRGEVNGYFSSLWSLTAIICPLLGSWMIGRHISPLWAASCLSLVGFVWFLGMRRSGTFDTEIPSTQS